MKTPPFIITLTGSSGCGKTYITDKIIDFGKQLENEGIPFKPRRHWKYVTRSYREIEIIDEKINHKEIDVKSIRAIPDDCEFIYRTYGDEYGFRKDDLQEYLDKGESPIIVINDVRVVEELKKEFYNKVLSLFLFREIIPDVETHKKVSQSRGSVSENKIVSRFERAVALYRVFIENIFLFDRVILNIPYEGEKFEDIGRIQAEGVIRGVIDGKILLNKKITKTSKLFIISGNAQSGKDDIIRSAKKMGKLQTDILKKYTSRWAEDGDEGEIECKFIPKASLLKQYEKEYQDEINNFEKEYTYEIYMNNKKNDEIFFRVNFEIDKLSNKNKIKTSYERFWQALQKAIGDSGYTQINNSDKKENVYLVIRDNYFQQNPKYIDLEKIVFDNKELYQKEKSEIEQRIPSKKENNSACLKYRGKPFVLYENNKALPDKNPIYYGYEIDKYVKKLKEGNKHIVLTASLPNIFKICRKHFGNKNVITAYTYSQIGQEEHIKHTDKVTGVAKLQEYDDILRYAYHIADFDYALIYAETSAVNRLGNQKDELVDQMFRLFRVYNK